VLVCYHVEFHKITVNHSEFVKIYWSMFGITLSMSVIHHDLVEVTKCNVAFKKLRWLIVIPIYYRVTNDTQINEVMVPPCFSSIHHV
jgi:hypothetical protein